MRPCNGRCHAVCRGRWSLSQGGTSLCVCVCVCVCVLCAGAVLKKLMNLFYEVIMCVSWWNCCFIFLAVLRFEEGGSRSGRPAFYDVKSLLEQAELELNFDTWRNYQENKSLTASIRRKHMAVWLNEVWGLLQTQETFIEKTFSATVLIDRFGKHALRIRRLKRSYTFLV